MIFAPTWDGRIDSLICAWKAFLASVHVPRYSFVIQKTIVPAPVYPRALSSIRFGILLHEAFFIGSVQKFAVCSLNNHTNSGKYYLLRVETKNALAYYVSEYQCLVFL